MWSKLSAAKIKWLPRQTNLELQQVVLLPKTPFLYKFALGMLG